MIELPTSLSELVFVKVQARSVHEKAKLAVGGVSGVTLMETLSVAPLLSVTVRVTVYVPAFANVWRAFLVVTAGLLSPKFQLYDAMLPSGSLLPSVKVQSSSVQLD